MKAMKSIKSNIHTKARTALRAVLFATVLVLAIPVAASLVGLLSGPPSDPLIRMPGSSQGGLSVTLSPGGATQVQAQSLSSIPGAFVDIGYGVRPVSLGNAFVGLADDVNTVYLNPAGLAGLSNRQVQFTHTQLMGLVDYSFFTAAMPLPRGPHAAGLTVIASGDDLMLEFSAHLAYGRELGPVKLGAAAKMRYSSFGNNLLNPSDFSGIFDPDEISEGLLNQVTGNGIGFGLDLGVLHDASDRLRFGIMLRDMVAPFKWKSETMSDQNNARGSYNEAVPFELAIGSSYRTDRTVTTVEIRPALDSEQDHALRLGTERTFIDIFSLRVGTEQWLNNLDDNKYMAGIGLHAPEFAGISLTFDYGFVYDQLANSHRIGFQVQF